MCKRVINILAEGEQGRKDNDMKYISEDRLTVLKEAVRRGTNDYAGLRTCTDAKSFLEESKYPLKFNVHFASSGDMTNAEVRLFTSQLITITMIADELTAMEFQTTRDIDPELTTDEAFEEAGNKLVNAIKNCEGGEAVEFIKAGFFEEA